MYISSENIERHYELNKEFMNYTEKMFFRKLKDDVLKQLNFKKKYKNLLEKKTFFYNFFFNSNSSEVDWGSMMSWCDSIINKNLSIESFFDFHKDLSSEFSFYENERRIKRNKRNLERFFN